MKKTLGIFLILCAPLLCVGCAQNLPVELPGLSTEKLSDEEQIAALLQDVYNGMQSKRVYKVLAHVSESYLDVEGRDYEAIRKYLTEVMRSYRTIRITRTRPKILVQGDRARAIETFGTIAEPANRSTTPTIDLQGQVAVYLERVSGEWKIVEWGVIR